ncbi:MAG: glycosyltransferase family 9 protein [Candidatus Melainabacteria bacterium]|nr:glycosyltransferase family 9 protein [Candidatus Melainabacteria bacterium]
MSPQFAGFRILGPWRGLLGRRFHPPGTAAHFMQQQSGSFVEGAEPVKLLLVRLSAHGDVIHTLPVLDRLKRQWPTLQVGWLVEADAAPLLANHPLIDRLHVCPRKAWLKRLRSPGQWGKLLQEISDFVAQLKAERYQISLDVQGLLKSALWPVWACVPHRLGFHRTREWADCCYTEVVPPMDFHNDHSPAVHQFLRLAQALAPNPTELEPVRFPLAPVPAAVSHQMAQRLQVLPPNQPIVALALGTKWLSKQWPAHHWRSLLHQLAALPVSVLLLGSQQDQPLASELMDSLQSQGLQTPWQTEPPAPGQPTATILNWCGQTHFQELPALLARLTLLVGADSLLLHWADAVYGQTATGPSMGATPRVVGLYGPTSPGRTGPYHQPENALNAALPCQPCHQRRCPLVSFQRGGEVAPCMEALEPGLVLANIKQQLNQNTTERY